MFSHIGTQIREIPPGGQLGTKPGRFGFERLLRQPVILFNTVFNGREAGRSSILLATPDNWNVSELVHDGSIAPDSGDEYSRMEQDGIKGLQRNPSA